MCMRRSLLTERRTKPKSKPTARIERIKRIYMKTIKINPDETGWVKIDGSVRTIVAHFKDGHKETFSLVDFLTFKRRNLVVQIDCYEEGEKIKED